MNSKVIKWFICHTGNRKTTDTETKHNSGSNQFYEPGKKKKRSLFKERSETLRKFSLSRLSLRKRRKQRGSPNPDGDITPDSSSGSHCKMSPVLDSHTKEPPTSEHVHSSQSELALNNSSGREKIVKQSSADASYPYEATFEREILDISSTSLPEQFKFDECVQLLKEADDFTESSEESSSNSASTIKRVDTFDDDSFMDCIDTLAEDKGEHASTLTRQTDNTSDIEQLANDITTHSKLENKPEIEQSHNSLENIDNSTELAKRKVNTISLNKEVDEDLIENEIINNTYEEVIQPPLAYTDIKSYASDVVLTEAETTSAITRHEINLIGICETDKDAIVNGTENTIVNDEKRKDSTVFENRGTSEVTQQALLLNGTFIGPDSHLEQDKNEAVNGDSKNQEELSLHSSSESLPKSNGQNENIAIFDDDGDISATSPTVDIENGIPQNEQILENNVKKLKKLKVLCIKNIKNKPPIYTLPPKPILGVRQTNSKACRAEDEIPKVKIVITHPSPEKSSATPHSHLSLPAEATVGHASNEHYPEELNPFGEGTGGEIEKSETSRSQKSERLQKSEEKHGNPFDSDSEDDRKIASTKIHNSRQTDHREKVSTSSELTNLRKSSNDNSTNPFAIYEDLENNRLSQSNAFTAGRDTTRDDSNQLRIAREETPPSLPPKLDSRLRRDSLSSSTPVPHPRKSKQGQYGSSSSLNYSAYPPVPYPRSVVPSDSSETLNSSLDSEERGNFVRGNARSSLPITSPIRFSKRKRTAPRPPNLIPSQRSASSDRASLRSGNDYHLKNSHSTTTSSPSNQPPPRPPPPKMVRDYKPTIKEKFLRIM